MSKPVIFRSFAVTFAAVCAALFLAVFARAEPLDVDDVLAGPVQIRYSGDTIEWTICADLTSPGDYAEYQIFELTTYQLVAFGVEDYVQGVALFSMTIPRVGMYGGRARSCSDGDEPTSERCSEWTKSNDFVEAETGACADGSRYVYAVLKPPGAPEL